MDTEWNASLLGSLTELLAEKNVTEKSIMKYLELFCDAFSFECGFIYERDQKEVLHLRECRMVRDLPSHKTMPLDALVPEVQSYISRDHLLFVSKSTASEAYEHELLHFFFAESLVLSALVDEESYIYGVLVFLNVESENILSAEKLHILTGMANVLEKNLIARIYRSRLFLAQTTLETILDNAGIDIYVNDFYTHDILYVNQSMSAPYGGKEKFMGKKCWETLFPGQGGPCVFCPQQKLIDENGKPTKVYSWDYERPFDGSWFRVFSAAFRWVDGRLAHIVSSADITENKRNEALIHSMANYDSLTALPNRRMLVSECERRINHAQTGEKGYLLFFDIDGFKAINDGFGHDAGDEFLIQLGAFFSSVPMLNKAIYRNGGDEFVALLDGNVSEDNIRNFAHFVHERFRKPWVLKNGSVFCNTSIGVASYPEDGLTAEILLNKADQAMYRVKQSGGGSIFFCHEIL